MNAVFILILIFIVDAAKSILNKTLSNSLSSKSTIGAALYSLITGLFSAVIYLFYTGFSLEINWNCIILSFLYAICCVLSAANISVYKYAHVATVTVARSSLNLIFHAIVGFFAFSETITGSKILKIIFVFGAMLCIFLDSKRKIEGEDANGVEFGKRKHNFLMFIFFMLIMIPVYIFSPIQAKLVSNYNAVPDVNTYFFFTNAFMLLLSVIWLMILGIKNKSIIAECSSLLKSRALVNMTLIIVISTFSALLGVVILKYMDLSLYSPISSSLLIVGSTIASLLFKEHIGRYIRISVILSIIAVFI